MNFNSTFSNPSFKGRRDDLNNIKSLSENNMPILPNKRQLILSAIDNVGKTADARDIEMLMGTVETMKYGIQNNSEFAKALGGEHGEKENNDWDGILQSTIRTAIDAQSEEDRPALEARFQKVFGEEKPLTEQEKQMLDLRQSILTSKEMTNVLDDADKTFEATRIRQNLDYFIASSEINNEDKVTCLKKMDYFLSDDYKINPQLKDHKVQAFSEILNDLIVQRPDEDAYTIKDANQKQTGMCAAISITRKAITYEDKVRAMEIMMAELDDKPTMEVYDRTQIGTGKKVEIQKAYVDFQDGMNKGYRIVDTGVHQWMNAADTIGDGTISTGHYQAFDAENYEIFRDAHWRNDLPAEYKPAQTWIRFLDKEAGAVDKAASRNRNITKVQQEIGQFKKGFETEVVKSDAAIRSTLQQLDPSMSDLQATTLTRQILKADKLEDKQYKVIDGESKEATQAKLAAFIKSQAPSIDEEGLKANMDKISGLRNLSNDANEKLAKLKSHSTPQAIFAYNKNLFTAAAHHRRSVEAELEIPERLAAYEKTLNVPARENLVQDSAQKVLNNLSSKAVVDKTAEQFGVEANADAVKLAVNNALQKSEVEIPAQLDNILEKMGMGDRATVVANFLEDTAEKVKAGDEDALKTFAENAHIKPDAKVVLKKIEAAKAELGDNPSNKQIGEAVSLLGYNNQIEMVADMYKTFTSVTDEMSNEQLTSVLGQNADKTIADMGKQIKSASEQQAQIERQLNLPTRKEVVLNVLEATGEVLPEKSLQAMQAKFDKVAEIKSADDNRIVDPSVKKPKVPDSAYKFTPAEKEVYAQIESKLPSMKAYAKVNGKAMKDALAPQLNELFAEAGRLNGQLWVGGEGESGLYDNQSVKLFEMITGKHYHNEDDIDKVVEHIKSGNGSGTSSTNVSHTSYSGHAQYVCEVSQVEVIDPVTKEKVMKDVLWHDNTWGRCEDSAVWTDERGVQRTDYGNGYGGPDGYIFNKHLLTGTFVEDQKVTPGVLPDGQKFDLWKTTRIAGVNPEADESIDKMMNQIFTLGSAEQKIAEFEQTLKQSTPVDFKLMDRADEHMGKVGQVMANQLAKINPQSQADVDAIKDGALKFILDKTALQLSAPTDEVRKYIGNILDKDSLAEVASKLPEIQKEMMAAPFAKGKQAPKQVAQLCQDQVIEAFDKAYQNIDAPANIQEVFTGLFEIAPDKLDGSLAGLKKAMAENAAEKLGQLEDKNAAATLTAEIQEIFANTIDENMAIKSLDDMAQYGDLSKIITKYVDKKMNTSTDVDLLAGLQKLQNMTNDEFNAFIADATNEDLGIKNVSTFDVVRQLDAQKSVATDAFEQNARIQVIMTEGPQSDNAPEWSYRGMKMDLSPLDNYTYVQQHGKEMFEKYGARAAFPKAEILSNEEIAAQVQDEVATIKDTVNAIKVAQDKGEAAAALNAEVRQYLKANIVPQERAKATGLINNYIQAVKKDSANADQAAAKLENFLAQSHITKDSNELLKAFITEVQSKNSDEATVSTLREYLTAGLDSAQVASVEYSLIDNAGNAIAAMTREKLADYNVQTATGEQLPLDSDEGIGFLVEKLANPATNSTALQTFFAQTGLSEKAVDVISNSVQLDALPDACKELEGQLTQVFGDVKVLDGQFEAFSSDSAVSYSTYKDAVEHYIKTLDKEYADKTAEQRVVYENYRKFLVKTESAEFAKNLAPQQIMSVLEKIHTSGVSAVSNEAMQGAQQLNMLSETLENKLSAMEALKLPNGSEKEAVRAEFLEKANGVYEQLVDVINNVNAVLA